MKIWFVVGFLLIHFVGCSFSQKTCNVLALSGGGSYGALQLGILDKVKIEQYDILTGVSIGGINAGVLSYFNYLQDGYRINDGINLLKNFYFSLKTEDVYSSQNFMEIINCSSLFKTHFESLFQRFHFDRLEYPSNEVIPKTLIGVFNLNNFKIEIHEFEKLNKNDQKLLISASVSIPFIFPVTKINETNYNDPGFFQNEILKYNNIERNECSNYSITYITTENNNISIQDVYNSIYNNNFFSNILSWWTSVNNKKLTSKTYCSNQKIRGKINYCYADTNKTFKLSKFDFNNGEKLFELGKEFTKCELIDYCH
jgi:predicted patatin/cPLA2 family phospholipase